jgi:hypothetical protein
MAHGESLHKRANLHIYIYIYDKRAPQMCLYSLLVCLSAFQPMDRGSNASDTSEDAEAVTSRRWSLDAPPPRRTPPSPRRHSHPAPPPAPMQPPIEGSLRALYDLMTAIRQHPADIPLAAIPALLPGDILEVLALLFATLANHGMRLAAQLPEVEQRRMLHFWLTDVLPRALHYPHPDTSGPPLHPPPS